MKKWARHYRQCTHVFA